MYKLRLFGFLAVAALALSSSHLFAIAQDGDAEVTKDVEVTTQANPDANLDHDEHEGLDPTSQASHEEATKYKTIEKIEMGQYRCDTWYFSPYPEGYHNIECLFLCEFCFNFYVRKQELLSHYKFCKLKHPPGDEIYRDEKISMFEIDGKKENKKSRFANNTSVCVTK